MKWLYIGASVALLLFAAGMIVLITKERVDRRIEVREALAANNVEKAQQTIDDMVFVRRKDSNLCFLVRADLYDGRGWASLDAIVIPVDCANAPKS